MRPNLLAVEALEIASLSSNQARKVKWRSLYANTHNHHNVLAKVVHFLVSVFLAGQSFIIRVILEEIGHLGVLNHDRLKMKTSIGQESCANYHTSAQRQANEETSRKKEAKKKTKERRALATVWYLAAQP